jgi:hypothetical protein
MAVAAAPSSSPSWPRSSSARPLICAPWSRLSFACHGRSIRRSAPIWPWSSSSHHRALPAAENSSPWTSLLSFPLLSAVKLPLEVELPLPWTPSTRSVRGQEPFLAARVREEFQLHAFASKQESDLSYLLGFLEPIRWSSKQQYNIRSVAISIPWLLWY